ncbi:hypothetical protein CASFOL_039528 [Castilleja foliolosa]|uniref:BHLH domain-containing protein n=1 Tax=Castilleja foliolosa TaxID=1961234 RepID=A0ABD3BIV7_9LAMI
MDQNPNSTRADRKTIEKNRRNQMKVLYSKLNSLVPHQSSRGVVSIPDQLEGATNYIKELQFNLEKMKQKKERLVEISANLSTNTNLPSIDVRVMGSALEVVLISGQNCQFMLSEIIQMLHEEGADVVNASFYVLDSSFFHTIHCKINGDQSLQEYGAARISDRLKKFVYDIRQI